MAVTKVEVVVSDINAHGIRDETKFVKSFLTLGVDGFRIDLQIQIREIISLHTY